MTPNMLKLIRENLELAKENNDWDRVQRVIDVLVKTIDGLIVWNDFNLLK